GGRREQGGSDRSSFLLYHSEGRVREWVARPPEAADLPGRSAKALDWRGWRVCERVGVMRAAGPFRACRYLAILCVAGVACAWGMAGVGPRAMAAVTGKPDTGLAATPAQPDQPIRIPLEPMGFQPVHEDFLLAGATGLTVDFVDNDHLLVTFDTKHLMRRDPDEQPGDDDRTVEAVLVELPSGKALARTEWRTHDRLQYLWNLGHGRFLLRVRDKLSMLAPLDRLQAGDAFRGTPVLDMGDRHIVALLVSSNRDLLTLETVRRQNGPAGTANDVTFEGADQGGAVQMNFYRLNSTAQGLTADSAGVVRAPAALDLPMTRAGILDILDGGKNRWLFNFDEHAGKVHELAE